MRRNGRIVLGVAGLVGALLLNGCLSLDIAGKSPSNGNVTVKDSGNGRYQVTVVPKESGGLVFKTDTQTGEIWSAEYNAGGGVSVWRKVPLDVR